MNKKRSSERKAADNDSNTKKVVVPDECGDSLWNKVLAQRTLLGEGQNDLGSASSILEEMQEKPDTNMRMQK